MNNLLNYLTEYEYNYIKNEKDLYKKSKILVEILFYDIYDKNNEPYINHLYRVSNKMQTTEGKIVGLLHDVVEDINFVTFADLLEINIPEKIIEILKLVTKQKHNKNISNEEKLLLYNEEIDKIINSGNELAIELKLSDMSDNFDEKRLKKLEKEKQIWFKLKYENNIKKLIKARENLYDRY